ncbi:MAG: anti-sigma factor [Dehalococcoidia bacterium]
MSHGPESTGPRVGCDHVSELLEAYALGALEASDAVRVQQHIEGCAECRDVVKEYERLLAVLPEALALASPLGLPSSLKERVLQPLQEHAPDPSGVDVVSGAGTGFQAPPRMRRLPPNGLSQCAGRGMRIQRRVRWLRIRAAIAVAAALALAVVLGLTVQLQSALTHERDQRLELARRLGQEELVLDVIDSNKTLKALLRPQAEGSSAYGKLYTRPDLPDVVLMAARLPMPPAGRVYRLWVDDQGHTFLAGTLSVNKDGFGLLVFRANRAGPLYDSCRLILQPPDSDSPAGDAVLVWQSGG